MTKNLQWAIERIMSIAHPKFWGSITLKYEAGKVVHIGWNSGEKPPKEAME